MSNTAYEREILRLVGRIEGHLRDEARAMVAINQNLFELAKAAKAWAEANSGHMTDERRKQILSEIQHYIVGEDQTPKKPDIDPEED